MRAPEIERVGIVGGGQLGGMLTEAALEMGVAVTVLEKEFGCPATLRGADQVVGDITDASAIERLATSGVQVITIEIEHVNTEALEALDIPVRPSPSTVRTIKDKLMQKRMLQKGGIPVGEFAAIDDKNDYDRILAKYGRAMIKLRSGGYDGKGNYVAEIKKDWREVKKKFDGMPVYAERMQNFDMELSAVFARDINGEVARYPLVQTIHRDSICDVVISPARISPSDEREAVDIAEETAKLLDGPGVYAIEMFRTASGILVNEIAPRVHNSGHHSIEGCVTSQFENHLRAIMGLPLGDTSMRVNGSAMINILGERDGPAMPTGLEDVARYIDRAYVHIYGKSHTRFGRKMGHITTLSGRDGQEAAAYARFARTFVTI